MVVDRNISYMDQTRTVQSMAVTVGVDKSHPKAWNSRHNHAQSPLTSIPGNPVICFYCLYLASTYTYHSTFYREHITYLTVHCT